MRLCLLLGASSGGRGYGSGQPADSCTEAGPPSRAPDPTPWDGAGPSRAVRRREHWTRDLADVASGMTL